MIELPRLPIDLRTPRIKVFGLGNAGCNALDRVVLDGIAGAHVAAVNTDSQALAGSVASEKLQIGPAITRGLGAGGDPELGRSAADSCREELLASIDSANVVFLLVGLGGGTGSGAAPLLAECARERNALVVVFATMPFSFEGKRRAAQAQTSLAVLRATADVVVCFENDRMADGVSPTAPIQEAFAAADETISQSVRALAAVASRRGLVHAGFDEIAAAVRGGNTRCLFGCGEAKGDNRAHEALELAFKNPLLDRTALKERAQNVIVSVSGGADLTLNEVQILMGEMHRHLRDDNRLFFGCAIDPQLAGRLSVSILGVVESDTAAPSIDVTPYLSSAGQAAGLAAAPGAPAIEPSSEWSEEEAVPPAESYGAAHYDAPTEAVEDEQLDAEYEPEQEDDAQVEPDPEPEPVRPPAMTSVRSVLPPRRPPFQPSTPARTREQRAEQMQLEPINRGRFEKSEPTIVDGQDLDVPTFLRRKF